MKELQGALLVLVMVAAVGLVLGCEASTGGELEVQRTYKGETGVYRVRTEETLRDGLRRREVRLKALKEETTPYAITGHDYDGDGSWDKVIICQRPTDGYNAMRIGSNGSMTWEPCSAEKDTAVPFTLAEIGYAQGTLTMAMNLCHSQKHLVKGEGAWRF